MYSMVVDDDMKSACAVSTGGHIDQQFRATWPAQTDGAKGAMVHDSTQTTDYLLFHIACFITVWLEFKNSLRGLKLKINVARRDRQGDWDPGANIIKFKIPPKQKCNPRGRALRFPKPMQLGLDRR